MQLEIGRAIRLVRQAKAIKLADLAQTAEISVPFLSLLECGERNPSLDVVRRIAAALGIPVEVLIVLAQPTNGTLGTSNSSTRRIVDAVRKLVEAEELLRARLAKEEKGEAR